MRKLTLFRLLTPISSLVARQLAHPNGWLGRQVMTRVLNRGNRELITATLDCLTLSPETRLLDVGFGGGLSLQLARQRNVARLYGVDPSVDAVEQLKRTSRSWIGDGELTLTVGVVERLAVGDGAVDAIISTNTLYFWPDLAAAFNKLGRVLAPHGQLALGFSSSHKLRSFKTVTRHGFLYYEHHEVLEQARLVGFSEVRLVELHGRDTEGDYVLVATRQLARGRRLPRCRRRVNSSSQHRRVQQSRSHFPDRDPRRFRDGGHVRYGLLFTFQATGMLEDQAQMLPHPRRRPPDGSACFLDLGKQLFDLSLRDPHRADRLANRVERDHGLIARQE
jgi:arsenite methyltransferase